ncbi:c-type cytochrome biogenesis protein CcsB [Pseudolysinimonas yzui]|uniref:C-type cytochrome biogenesis protein CcsB n=1 Tax=Pseudolysinimonas yzui TaxID=2708254 RepID=A0A8J3GQ09_9MICO|nr:c-type cytochrome biogenesis protein CcsB [Pseudolysinimonas yzui]GHF13499.1 c-type cytochrome biogenesis protein CcsB [Pseudolysinimonas yzui]
MTTETLAAWSLVGVYSAAAVYLGAFVLFLLDLAKRSSTAPAPAQAEVAATAGTTAVLIEAPPAPPTASTRPGRNARIGFALTALGWAVHVLAIVLRGVAAERVPWANMFEFALTGTGIIVGVFLFANLWKDLRFLGTFVTGLAVLLLVLATRNLYVDVIPLPPALDSAWLVIHVLVAILGTGFFALGAGLSITQLLQQRREAGRLARVSFLTRVPGSTTLETLAYRVNVIGFVLWTFTLMFGAIWAERAWGRYWGWDTKEVWTFVIWVVFAGYIHARATRGWRGTPSAVLAIIGFAAVLFNFTVVNVFFTGLHAYSGL